jgi:hypothetical protein
MHPEKRKFIEEIKNNHPNKPLVFVHTPKCGGTYVRQILKDLNILNKGHSVANPEDNAIHFTVIREPVSRFESLLNYRLSAENLRNDWPKHLHHVHKDNTPLNKIVKQMSDTDIISFKPFKTLHYWTQNIDICIQINEIKELLEIFGYDYDETTYAPANVSPKKRGKLNKKNKERIQKLFKKDMKIFNKWTVYKEEEITSVI